MQKARSLYYVIDLLTVGKGVKKSPANPAGERKTAGAHEKNNSNPGKQPGAGFWFILGGRTLLVWPVLLLLFIPSQNG